MSSQELTAVMTSGGAAGAKRSAPTRTDEQLREVAQQFEAAFLAEMLKAAKVGEAKGPFSGGQGADTFRSFLTREYANEMAAQGSFGLADKIYAQLKQKVAADVE